MDTKSAIFVTLGFLLVMTIYSSSSNSKKVTPHGIDQIIHNTINEVGTSNPNVPKDLDGMKSDKGITKSPIE